MYILLNYTLLELAHEIVRDLGLDGHSGLLGDIVDMYVDRVVVVRLTASSLCGFL